MIRLIDAEFIKLLKRQMTRVLLFVLVGILVIMYLLLLAVSKVAPLGGDGRGMGNAENLLGLPVAIPFAFSMLSSLGTVLAVILIGSSVGSEYSWRTVRTMLICSESRARFLGAKLVTAAALIFVGAIIGVATGFIMSLITTALGGYSFDFSFMTSAYIRDQFLQFWRTLFIIMPYVLLGFLFAVVGRSATSGIALGIGVLFLESIITTLMRLAGGWVADVPNYLLAANVRVIAQLNSLPSRVGGGFGGGGFDISTPGVWHAAIVLSLYSLAFLIAAFYLFRKRDVTS
ncbi:MAG: hypothetical protein HYX87_08750 [Chloroflexi bacterium]|nr:hypothetical protein [Chloroflexota bacterium]